MKRFISIAFMTFFLGIVSIGYAQDKDSEVKKDVKKGTNAIKKGARKVGNKTAEVASKGKARVTDAKHKDKVGPNNETIYIDNHSKYYWVDDKGHRHYVTKSELKDKPNNK
ncbi:MAG TPA: hypothetical protein VM012_01740 [Flavitalea sp.]|nr:hypothetical protein [Flavitalea sp.]